LVSVLEYDPKLTGAIVGLGIIAAVLEGVGLSFILPIIDLVQSGGSPPMAALPGSSRQSTSA